MRSVILLVCINSFTFGMNNQITPSNHTPTTDTSSMSDEQVCSWALRRFCHKSTTVVNPELTTAIARNVRESMHDPDIEEDTVHSMVIEAVNEALAEKEKEIRNRISKRHSAYIAIATGVLSTTITALAAIYNTTHNKCS